MEAIDYLLIGIPVLALLFFALLIMAIMRSGKDTFDDYPAPAAPFAAGRAAGKSDTYAIKALPAAAPRPKVHDALANRHTRRKLEVGLVAELVAAGVPRQQAKRIARERIATRRRSIQPMVRAAA